MEVDEVKARRAKSRRAEEDQMSKRLGLVPFLVTGKEEKRSATREVSEEGVASSAMGISTRKRGWRCFLSFRVGRGRGLLRGFWREDERQDLA